MSTTMAGNRVPGSPSRVADVNDIGAALVRSWWLIALRGLFGVLFGLGALILPLATILALVLLFSAYMIVDGVFSIAAAFRVARQGNRWGLLALQGIASLATGALAFLWPGITIVAFVFLVAAWSIVMGCLSFAAAVRIDGSHGRWWLALNGIASLMFGLLALLAPLAGAVVLTWWIGAFALVFGVLLIILAFRLRSRRNDLRPMATVRPTI
ncbi:MAG TPA: HdeD family acid-resistance protein [Steroidobacteraceae bacterium]